MRARVLAVTWVAACLAAGCSDDHKKTEPDPTFPYTVPTSTSMSADMSALTEAGAAGPNGVCHAAAALIVAAIDLNVAVRLAVPALALGACAAQQPVYAGDQTWKWTASGGTGQGAWTAELSGHVVEDAVVAWEMRVSGTAFGLDRFVWFHGTADGAAHQGVWQFNDAERAEEPTQIVECTWSLPADGPRDVAFENTDASSPDSGDRLNYILSGTAASMVFFDASRDRSAQIAWDTATGAGSMISLEGDRCCWDVAPTYSDVDCPR